MTVKKILFVILITIFSFFMAAQNPQEIISRCVITLGGEAAIIQFSDFQGMGRTKMFWHGREFGGKFKIVKKGKKSWEKSDILYGKEESTRISAFDGQVAWSEKRGNISDKPSLNYHSDLNHTFSVLINKEAFFSRVKDTEIEGKKAFGIEMKVKGKKTIFFIDQNKYTVLEMVFIDSYFGDNETKEVLEKRIRYFDYKKFGSVLFPTRTVFYQKGKKEREYTLSKITFNPMISSSLFSRPAQKLDLRYSEERLY